MRKVHDRAQSSTATQKCHCSTWVSVQHLPQCVCGGGKVLSYIKYLLTACYGLDIVSAPNHVLNPQSFVIEFEGSTSGMQFQGDEVSLEDNALCLSNEEGWRSWSLCIQYTKASWNKHLEKPKLDIPIPPTPQPHL